MASHWSPSGSAALLPTPPRHSHGCWVQADAPCSSLEQDRASQAAGPVSEELFPVTCSHQTPALMSQELSHKARATRPREVGMWGRGDVGCCPQGGSRSTHV